MSGWFGVRCVFRDLNNEVYEERITLWQASDAAQAIALAEEEAVEYAAVFDNTSYVGLAQSFELSDLPVHGGEVFSLMRDSELAPNEYLSTFFSTGAERVGDL
ncbi:hypothetical protein [Spirillospora sp. CA-294931]|uniref:hypothetical protein n=1 Tax=Spirillospora sp. CA-294931 TaxID=3240042 RepID=UPI003D91A625